MAPMGEAVWFLLRWTHFLAGITWIGLLYYFNFVQTPFFAETEPPVRSGAIQKLVPNILSQSGKQTDTVAQIHQPGGRN